MIDFLVSRRKTFRYVGTYRDLDDWEDLGFFRHTPVKCVAVGNGLDEDGAYTRWVKVPVNTPLHEIIPAIEDTLTRVGCAHEYDCCGCLSYRTHFIRRRGRKLLFKTYATRNY